MNLKQRIDAFVKLGTKIKNIDSDQLQEICFRAQGYNSWFTEANVMLALKGVSEYLDFEKIKQWSSPYELDNKQKKIIGTVMAGNIPLVGFHDYLAILISGNILKAKLSSQDSFLIRELTQWLFEIEPAFESQIQFVERLSDFDAVIATGSDNSARYFNQYFGKFPNIIRRNRSSCAVLDGSETSETIDKLGKDITQYFGLGCRNVSKLFVPEEYDFKFLLDELQAFSFILDHHKYANNYDYNKSIYLVNGTAHLDSGFLLLKEDTGFISPISVLYFEYYQSKEKLSDKLNEMKNKVQCIVSQDSYFSGSTPFGSTQKPELWDYADGVDTLNFLTNL